MSKCLYKIISESNSREGIAFQSQLEKEHDELDFNRCKRCSGIDYLNKSCNNYRENDRQRNYQKSK